MVSRITTGSSPDVSTLLLPQDRITTASQTDLSGEVRAVRFSFVRILIYKLSMPM